MKNLRWRDSARLGLCTVLLFCLSVTSSLADPPVDRDFLRLSDGRWIWLKKIDTWSTQMIMGKGKNRNDKKNIIWSKVYEDNPERTWDYAYFSYLRPKKLLVDLDHDGFYEVAIATYDMGTLIIRPVTVFSIRPKELVYLHDTKPINLSTDEPVFKK